MKCGKEYLIVMVGKFGTNSEYEEEKYYYNYFNGGYV